MHWQRPIPTSNLGPASRSVGQGSFTDGSNLKRLAVGPLGRDQPRRAQSGPRPCRALVGSTRRTHQTCACAADEEKRELWLAPAMIAVEPPELIGGDVSVTSAPASFETRSAGQGRRDHGPLGAGVKTGEDVGAALRGRRGVCPSGVTKARPRRCSSGPRRRARGRDAPRARPQRGTSEEWTPSAVQMIRQAATTPNRGAANGDEVQPPAGRERSAPRSFECEVTKTTRCSHDEATIASPSRSCHRRPAVRSSAC